MVPTEEELRFAYTARIHRLQTGILDVVRLDEVEYPPHSESSDEGNGKGGYSGKGSVDCPAIGGSFTGTFTSYFMATYELVRDSNDDVPAAVAALSTAYNKVIQRYEADINMEMASIYATFIAKSKALLYQRHWKVHWMHAFLYLWQPSQW